MRILIGCTKDMADGAGETPAGCSEPMFQERATLNALQMMRYDEDELRLMLRCNAEIASLNRLRYARFADDGPRLPAMLAYTGVVFKYLDPASFSSDDMDYARDNLRVTSFLYGLLRPMDAIKPYRLEGDVSLPDNGVSMFDYWKPVLTDVMIDYVAAGGGVLLDLASAEMRRLFDWRRISRGARVVKPEFMVSKGGRLKTVVVYAKMCRGAMARYVIKNKIMTPEALRGFSFEGFRYSEEHSREDAPVFVLD